MAVSALEGRDVKRRSGNEKEQGKIIEVIPDHVIGQVKKLFVDILSDMSFQENE